MERICVSHVFRTKDELPSFLAIKESEQALWEERFEQAGYQCQFLKSDEKRATNISDEPDDILEMCALSLAHGFMQAVAGRDANMALPIVAWENDGIQLRTILFVTYTNRFDELQSAACAPLLDEMKSQGWLLGSFVEV